MYILHDYVVSDTQGRDIFDMTVGEGDLGKLRHSINLHFPRLGKVIFIELDSNCKLSSTFESTLHCRTVDHGSITLSCSASGFRLRAWA